jgi:multidrug resistance efflux pump
MDTAFLRTLRSLDDDGRRRSIGGMAVIVSLFAAWSGWFFFVPVTRFEVTDIARVEIDQASHPIQSETSGRVRVSHFEMGRDVQAGDLLLELDTNPEQLVAREERARLDALSPQVQAIREQLAAIDRTETREREATNVALDEARARFREADALATAAADEVTRFTKLRASGLIPERDLAQAKAEAVRRRAAAESLALAVTRLESEQRTRDSDRDVSRRRLRGEISKLEGERTTGGATLDRLQYEADRRVVRAPVSGRIGEAQVVRAGAYIYNGDVLGAIVPTGALRIVAEFSPASAFGRIHPGQPARLKLQGFSWTEYGSVAASVCAVAEEIRDGRVRVEMSLSAPNTTRVPLQHGLPGSVEVEVERITPARLVFRAAGQLLSSIVDDSTGGRP